MTDRIDAIHARLAAATPGPWETRDSELVGIGTTVQGAGDEFGFVVEAVGPEGDPQVCADAELIAHAPSDLAALLAVARAAQEWEDARRRYHINDVVAAERGLLDALDALDGEEKR